MRHEHRVFLAGQNMGGASVCLETGADGSSFARSAAAQLQSVPDPSAQRAKAELQQAAHSWGAQGSRVPAIYASLRDSLAPAPATHGLFHALVSGYETGGAWQRCRQWGIDDPLAIVDTLLVNLDTAAVHAHAARDQGHAPRMPPRATVDQAFNNVKGALKSTRKWKGAQFVHQVKQAADLVENLLRQQAQWFH